MQRTKRQKVAVSTSDAIENPVREVAIIITEKELVFGEPEPHSEEGEIREELVVSLPREIAVPVTDHGEDSTHEAAAKAVEQEHSKAIVVFERAKKRRQEQMPREEAATADATQRDMATTALTFPMRPSSMSVEVDQM